MKEGTRGGPCPTISSPNYAHILIKLGTGRPVLNVTERTQIWSVTANIQNVHKAFKQFKKVIKNTNEEITLYSLLHNKETLEKFLSHNLENFHTGTNRRTKHIKAVFNFHPRSF
jgi:hypothetical protein